MRSEAKSSIQTSKRLAKLLDSQFSIGSIRIGLDSVIGLLPIAGDSLAFLMSSYIVLTAFKLNLPFRVKLKMIWNLLMDYFIGIIPLLGDIFDLSYKANLRNVRLLEDNINL